MSDYTIKQYTVTGSSLKDVGNQFKFLGHGGRFASETRGGYRVRIPDRIVNSKTVYTVTTTVEVPHWSGVSQQTHPVQREWNRFMNATMIHEMGHVNRYLQLKNSLNLVMGMSAERGNRRLREIYNKIKKQQDRYHVETNHGANQGAVLNINIK